MKMLFVLNLLLLIAAIALGDVFFGACAFIGLGCSVLDVVTRNACLHEPKLTH